LWIKKHHINYQDPSLGDAIDEFEALYFLELQNHVFIYGTYIGKKFPEVPDSYERSLRSWPDIYAHPGLADALEYGENVAPPPPPEKKKDPKRAATERKRT
jgi:hypothetical protein